MSCQYCCSGDAKCIRDGCVTCCNCGRELTEAMDYPFDGFPQKTSDWQECGKVVAKLKAEVAELKAEVERGEMYYQKFLQLQAEVEMTNGYLKTNVNARAKAEAEVAELQAALEKLKSERRLDIELGEI